MTFAIVKKGYDPRAVDEYIARTRQEHQDQMQTAKDRNQALAEHVEDLQRELSKMRDKETRVTRILTDLDAVVERTRRAVDARSEEELSRLGRFRDKWVEYATRYLHQNLSEFAEKLDEYAYDYAHRVQQDLNENLFMMADPLWADYQAEKARTDRFSQAPVHIDELLAKLREKE